MLERFFGLPRFEDIGEVVVSSDPKSSYRAYARKMPSGNFEVVTNRLGVSGGSWSLREVKSDGPQWRYLGEGDTLEEAAAGYRNRNVFDFSETIEDSISDVVVRHTLASMRELAINNKNR